MGALVLDEVHQISVLADEFVARRQVHNHIGAIDGGDAAGRSRYPQVLADFHRNTGTARLKNLMGAERHFLITHHNAALAGDCSDVACGEPPFLVEFFIIRDIGLGHHPHLALIEHHGTVEQVAAAAQRSTHDKHYGSVLVAVAQGN